MSQADFEYLGPYQVERILGRGGMGSVYKGVHAKSGEPVAIKVIATGIANQTRFRRRFAAEVEALKRLKHPNIVELIGYGEEKGMLFYSMEYVDGHSLHEHLRQHGALPWEEVVQVGIETTAALKHAHNIGIIHRDLKPANLMLNVAGNIKLTDFGISKLFGSTDETAAGSVIGTADYMPPEQAEGKPVNVRSDLYSLGCVMYALLAGKAPFGGKSVPEVLYSVRYNPVPNLATLVSDVPEELIDLIHQLLEKDPQKRPPTALVVGNRLKAMQQGLQRKTSLEEDKPGDEVHESSTRAEVGTQLTSLDLSDVDDNELKLTGAEMHELGVEPPDGAETDRGLGGLGTHEQRTILAPNFEPPSRDSQSLEKISSRDGELSISPTSQADSEAAASAVQITSGGPSHFTPVGASGKQSFTFGGDVPEPKAGIDWVQVGSMIGICVLLLGSLGVGWWMLQPQSANEVHAAIMQAVESGDDGQLLAARAAIDEFLARFPDDERQAEVQALADEAELIRRAKLLQRKASRAGGLEELSAIEQAFLDCLQARSKDVATAQRKLAAFIAVFGQLENLDASDRRLVQLAEFAARAGENVVIQPEPAAKAQLETLIQSAEKALPAESLQSYYRDLLLLYANKPWAVEQMDRIRKKLKSES